MKRKYVKPGVESEEAFEQTSLQCNLSYFPMEYDCEWGESYFPGFPCEVDVSKGGAFPVIAGCDQEPYSGWICAVLLS